LVFKKEVGEKEKDSGGEVSAFFNVSLSSDNQDLGERLEQLQEEFAATRRSYELKVFDKEDELAQLEEVYSEDVEALKDEITVLRQSNRELQRLLSKASQATDETADALKQDERNLFKLQKVCEGALLSPCSVS
jgi:DNA repair exonuclease SbcCD ATPase subunit